MNVITRVADQRATTRAMQAGPVAGLIADVALLAALAATVGLGGAGWVVGVGCGVIPNAALARGLSRSGAERLGPAVWVTLARATLAVGVAALVADSFDRPAPVAMLVALAVVALDAGRGRRVGRAAHGHGVDARRALRRRGRRVPDRRPQRVRRALHRRVGARDRRGALRVPRGRVAAAVAARAAAAALLAQGRRGDAGDRAGDRGRGRPAAGADPRPPSSPRSPCWPSRSAATCGGCGATARRRSVGCRRLRTEAPRRTAAARAAPRRGRVRTGIAECSRSSPLLLVWVALVAPNQPGHLTPSAFVRLPLEGLVVVALALVLPPTARRLLACVVGLVLGLLMLVKILDIGFLAAFDRPFDPVDDWSYTGIGIETLRDSIGRTAREPGRRRRGGARRRDAGLHDPGGASPDPGRGRPPRAVAPGRRRARRRLGALLGVRRAARRRHADRLHERRRPRRPRGANGAGRRPGSGGLRRRDRHDPFADTPGNRLLTGLRGKDVLLVFVESYGQVAVQDSSFSPQVDAALDGGTRSNCRPPASPRRAPSSPRRRSAASAGWRTPPCSRGSGSTASGATTSSSSSDRFTLSDAFKRAGWRTINDVPSDNRDWPQGTSFYHYDKLYDRRERRLSRPELRLRVDARPVHPRRPAPPRAREGRTAGRSSRRSTWCRATRRGPASPS